MADFTLTLGEVAFQDFEVPESIRAGGAQALDTKKYSNGTRTVDAFGPDDDAIAWSGTFFDGTAEARCQQIDTMRRQGKQIQVSWASFSYLVTVKAFTFDFVRFYEIHYSITLEVVQDLTQPASAQPTDFEKLMKSDIAESLGLSDALDAITAGVDAAHEAVQPLIDAVGEVSSAVDQVNSITGGSIPFLNDLAGKVHTAQGISDGLVAAADGDLTGLGDAANFASGVVPADLAKNINLLVVSAQSLPTVYGVSARLGRLAKNVAGVTQ